MRECICNFVRLWFSPSVPSRHEMRFLFLERKEDAPTDFVHEFIVPHFLPVANGTGCLCLWNGVMLNMHPLSPICRYRWWRLWICSLLSGPPRCSIISGAFSWNSNWRSLSSHGLISNLVSEIRLTPKYYIFSNIYSSWLNARFLYLALLFYCLCAEFWFK